MVDPTEGSSWTNVSTRFFRFLKWRCLFLFCSRCVDKLHTLAGTFVWKSETLGTHRFAVSLCLVWCISLVWREAPSKLYAEGQDDSPIAYSSMRGGRHSATISLTLKPGLDHILVEIITSFLVLEYNYRMEHKAGREMILTALTGYNYVDWSW